MLLCTTRFHSSACHCFLIFLNLFCPLQASNFLFFLVGTNQFERHSFEFLAQELGRRGHKVVTVKPILIPEESRLVHFRLHMVHEKVLKDVLPSNLYTPLEMVGADVPWRDAYETDAHLEPYWAAHTFACQRMLNSDLMEVIAREQIELAVLYTGNPCQLGFVHTLRIPFVLVDMEGLTDETIIAANAPWSLPSAIHFEKFGRASGDGNKQKKLRQELLKLFWTRLNRVIELTRETLSQSGVSALARAVSKRYQRMDVQIWEQFQGDYEIRRKFPAGFPGLNLLKRQAQLFLVNTDSLIEQTPLLSLAPLLLTIGAAHIDSIRPLFAPWNESIASAEQGVILVSFGTQVNSSAMPEKLVHSFLHVFSLLRDYRISFLFLLFWRISPKLALSGFDANGLQRLQEGMPHLNITTYFPQNELLANPRTRLLSRFFKESECATQSAFDHSQNFFFFVKKHE